jgi:hypothetical protein
MRGAGSTVVILDTIGKYLGEAVGWKCGMRVKLADGMLAIGRWGMGGGNKVKILRKPKVMGWTRSEVNKINIMGNLGECK